MTKKQLVIRSISLALISLLLGLFPVSKLNAQCQGFMVDITSDPPPPFNLCPGETILLISIVTGGTPPYTYLWADGTTGPTTILTPPYFGSFPLDVTDAVGCVASNSIHIKASVWLVDILYVGFSVCVGDSMEIFAFPDFPGGTTFLWSTGETSNSIFITTSGTYSLTATAPGGACSSSVSEYIEMPFFPQPEPIISGPTVLCPGQNATLTAQGEPDDIYNWSTGATTSSIIISTPGIYSVTATNWQGCSGTDSIEVLSGSDPPILSAPSVLCNGQNGTIEITNASSYIDFDWSTGETTSSITINAPGTYSVTVTASGGCTASGSVTIDSGSSDINITGTTAPVTSCTNPDGSVNITVIPSGSYSFIWSNGSNTEDISGLSSGSYSVTVTDIGGCTSSAPFTVTSNVVLPTTSTSFTPTSCDLNNGAIDLSVTPAGTYTFSWSNAETTEDLSNILAGIYTVTVNSTSNGCTATASVTVPNINLTINITGNTTPFSSCTMPNGAIDITPSPAGTYIFTWSNGETTEDLSNLSPGSYTVTVSAGGSCTSNATYIVANNTAPPVPTVTTMAATCSQSNGAVDLTVTPAGSYSFLWSNGASTEDLSAIPAGTYAVTVTDLTSGCSSTASAMVPDNPIAILISGTTTPNTSCLTSNGAIDISTEPAGTYTYLWSNGATSQDLNALAAGTYTVTVTLGISCISSATFIVLDNTSPPTPAATTMAATCSQSNGAIDLSVTPAGSYSFLWSNGASTEDLSAIPAGTYAVTVTDLTSGCSSTVSAMVPDNPIAILISGTTTPNTSCLTYNGAIDISTEPAGTFTYLWSNGATSQDLNALAAGSYTVTVTLGVSCMQSTTFQILDDINPIILTGIPTPNTSCSQPIGAIDLSVIPAGTYIYVWSNGNSTEDLNQLTGGTYAITVTGSNGCTATSTFDIVNTSSNFIFIGSVTPNSSCNTPNGNIDITLSPAGVYTYVWSNGGTSEDLNNLAAGNYGLTVTDVNSCSSVATYSIADSLLTPAVIGQLDSSTCGGNNGAIDITILPSAGNSFIWSNGSTTEDLLNLPPGIYSVTVTGANGCVSSDTFSIINQNSNFTLSAIPVANNSCLNPNGSIDLSVIPSGSYTFVWSNAAATEDIQNLAAGMYSVTVTDPLNCTSSDTFLVLNNTTAPLLSANLTPSVCGASNGAIDLMVIPGINNTILWSNGAITEDLLNIPPATYSVIVEDANGCQALDTFEVLNQNSNFSFSALPVSNTSCLNPNGSIDLSVTPLGAYTFLWSNGTAVEDLTNLSAGSYTVTVTDATACSSTGTFVVADNTPVITISSIVNPSVCGAGNGSIDLTITPSAGNNFIWSNGALTEDVQNLNAGNFSVTVSDPGGCSASDTFSVPELGSSFTLSGFPTANTNCIAPNGSIDLSVIPTGAYSYLWSNTITSEDQVSLAPGIYSVTVSDVNGCSSTESFIISDQTIQPVITETIVPSTCGNANGQIDITINPVGTYLFAWSNGSATEDLSDVPSGMYAVTVTDMNGCSAATSLVVQNTNSNFSLTAIPSANTSCTQSNGTINLTVTPSGNYTFLWSNGAISEDILNLPAGLYAVTVMDATNCSTSDIYVVDEQVVNLFVVETITPVLCGETNGSIDLNVTPPSGNSFIWSNGSTTEDLDNILPGPYSVTVTGQTGCLWSSDFNVPGSEKIEIELEVDVIESGDAFVTLRAQVNVPLTALDTIMWLPEALFDCNQDFCLEQTITRPAAQTEIKVIAIDRNGCLAQASLQLEEVSNPKVYIPNVFSPDADGINDMFTVYGNKDVEMIDELQIFDRWGNQVFVNTEFPPNEENYGWDGSFKNSGMNPAVFAYWARVKYKDGTEGSYKGDVTLVR